jgi:hypothetical protein
LAGKVNKLSFFLDIFSGLTLSQELVFIICFETQDIYQGIGIIDTFVFPKPDPPFLTS